MNEKITDKQGISIIFLATLGSTLVLGTARPASRDAWISIIFAVIISLIMGLCYARLFSNFHGKNLFEICQIVFGKILGKIFIILFIWYSLLINAFIIRDIGEFIYIIGVVRIREISQVFTMTITILLCIYMTKKSVSVLGRFCAFFLPLVVFMIVLGYILSLNNMSPKNLLPVMYDGIRPIIEGTLSSISFPFTESIVFIMIFDSLENKSSIGKVLTKGVLFAGILLFIMAICDIMILGTNTLITSYFPSYTALKRIEVGNFLERIEVTIILSFIFGVFVKSTCYLIATCKGIATLFNLKDYILISTPVGLLVVSISYLLYDNIKELLEMTQFDTYNGIFFQIILFFILFIGAEIKIRKRKSIN
ncbi:endospore germination permease [Clostridium sp. MSJ-4]|uniref:Endospore germination permease n=1 Tax=Clostridium simiarum TaxID=2841506 RepID=A0ABS6F3F9_9CLOT|nr:endospore germination permease [Clostridium simiarum]MBU5593014.1 endospore germination permease [Clostridium simiarum]